MKFSYHWLQTYIEEALPAPEALIEHIIFHMTEVEGVENMNDDTILDINILPNRAGDCLSHRGMAREIAGMLGLTLKNKDITPLPAVSMAVPLDIKSELCRAYTAVRIDGVKVALSPTWLTTALESIGQRSINNIVDATNYVLFDLGQPIHAFDAAKVDGGIVVRTAHDGERIELLGAKSDAGAATEKLLKETDLVIADYMGAIALAGVKGGATAELDDATTSIIVEVANFDPIAVRKTSRRLGLITDASKRFENNVSPIYVEQGIAQVVALILELAGGTVSAMTVHAAPAPVERTLSFTLADLTRLLGNTITASSIDRVFSQYGYQYTKKDDTYTLTVPSWRADLTGAHDIAEEVGRVVGYDTIPALALPFTLPIEPNMTELKIAAVRAWALEDRCREVYTYTFRPKGDIAVSYGAKGKDKLRTNLSDGLKESYELNRLNAPFFGFDDVRVFEVGTVFVNDGKDIKEEVHVAICDKSIMQELTLDEFITEKKIEVGASVATEEALRDPHPFVMWSSYPFVTRDLAVWANTKEDIERLRTIANIFAREHCVREPQLFDTFSKDGRISVAYRFIFQSFEKTLTDAEVTASFQQLLDQIKADTAFEIR